MAYQQQSVAVNLFFNPLPPPPNKVMDRLLLQNSNTQSMLGQPNLFHPFTTEFCKIHYNIIILLAQWHNTWSL